MSARYHALQSPLLSPDARREMDDAFESDSEEEAHESTQMARPADSRSYTDASNGNTYDFEREYDMPPPGSPPRPSAVALPNDFGNSNGLIPSSPVQAPARPSFLRRAIGVILPTHYARVPTEPGARGGGTENDGVFANVMAKPSRPRAVFTEDGNVHLVPEDNQKEAPPSYADAQADAAPSYWETTVHAPSGLDSGSGMIIDNLPSGSVFLFALNLFTSFFFQFVGFLLTYVLHTSHAAKYGSRAGLGLTLIQYGFYSRSQNSDGTDGGEGTDRLAWAAAAPEPSDPPLPSTSLQDNVSRGNVVIGISTREWLSFLLITLGWFLLLSSIIGFWRVKRWESSIRASSTVNVTPGDADRELATRRNIEQIFGIEYGEGDEMHRGVQGRRDGNVRGPLQVQFMLEEARLTRDLRDAGLL